MKVIDEYLVQAARPGITLQTALVTACWDAWRAHMVAEPYEAGGGMYPDYGTKYTVDTNDITWKYRSLGDTPEMVFARFVLFTQSVITDDTAWVES
jgi:hypothetical protein